MKYGSNGFTRDEYDKAMNLFVKGARGEGGIMAFGNDAALSKAIVGYVEPVEGVVDLHLHRGLNDLNNFVIKQDGSSIRVSVEAMAQAINELYPTATHIRLFVCHGNEIAEELAKRTNKQVFSSSDLLRVGENGYKSSTGKMYSTSPNGETSVIKKQ